ARRLLTDEDFQLLQNKDYDALVAKARETLYSPVTAVNSSLLATDPLFTFSRFIQNLQRDTAWQWANGWPYVKSAESFHVIYLGSLKASAFDLDLQQQLVPLITQWRDAWLEQHPNGEVRYSGALFFADHGVKQAKQEVTLVGAGSLCGILLLFLFAFRGGKPLLLVLVTVFAGVAAGLAMVLLLFGKVYLMALIFGATLLGISIDYSFHFLSEYYYGERARSGKGVIASIQAALLLGFISSAVAYMSLVFGQFPGLHQIALFSATGLGVACITVILMYPLAFPVPRKELPLAIAGLQRMITALSPGLPMGRRYLLIAMVVVLSAGGIIRLQADDDIRLLQPVSPALKEQQQEIEALLGGGWAQQFFVVRANDMQALLEQEELLRQQLALLKAQGVLSDTQMLSQYLPSSRRQLAAGQMLKDIYRSDVAAGYFAETGIPLPEAQHSHSETLNLARFRQSPLAPELDRFLLSTGPAFFSVVFLKDLTDTAPLAALAQQHESIFWLDRTQEISQVFRDYRRHAGYLLLVAIAVITLFLVIRYGIRRGLLSASIPIMSCICVLGILGYLAAPFNLFHLLGLMVVLGLGLDYAIFLSEYRTRQLASLIAIGLSVVTTLLAFGLLSLSSTPAVSSFGVVILLGVSLAFLFSSALLTGKGPVQ
ncbi:MAG: hypothetical protein R3208_19070, partial [Ketobacteraceae bacterium]|nr:hypothetical protein [Ketobacteraceae bacterium]